MNSAPRRGNGVYSEAPQRTQAQEHRPGRPRGPQRRLRDLRAPRNQLDGRRCNNGRNRKRATKPPGAKRPRGKASAKARARAAVAGTAPRIKRFGFTGRHAVAAALANPARRVHRLIATPNAERWLAERGTDLSAGDLIGLDVESARPDAIDRILPAGSVHQGLAAAVDDLPRNRLQETCRNPAPGAPAVVLDQITDPQNIGAIFRSAAAFGARAVIVQDRRTPPLAGALAKAAAGAVETVPCVHVVNVARALEGLQGLGYYCAGLAGEADHAIGDLPRDRPPAIVLGAEGAGLRQLVAATCDGLFRIPIRATMESLNVSTAAAIALYEAARVDEPQN